MSTTDPAPRPARPYRWESLLVVVLAVGGLAVLRLAPEVRLDGNPLLAWSAPLAAGAVALAAAVAMLVAIVAGLQSGSVASFLNATGKGMLAATYAVEAFNGPGSAAFVPSAASAVGGLLAALFLLAAALLGMTRSRLPRPGRVAALVAILALSELTLALVAITLAAGYRRPEETLLRLVSGGLLLATAVAVTTHARHALAPTLLGIGTLGLAVARPGTADLLGALVVLVFGLVVFAVHHLAAVRAQPGLRRPEPLAAPALPLLSPSVPSGERGPDELAESQRLARELRATIDELAQARRTIELQRAELDRATNIDALTGVASRTAILGRLRFESAEARRYQHPVALLLLDVDRLGLINADHGTQVGDAVLREVALRMRLRIREADALGRADGGGFLAILPHTDERGAALFAETLRRRIADRPFLVDGGALEVRVSIGVALMRPGSGLHADELLANADEALRSARAAGGNRIAFDRAHGLVRLDPRRLEPGRLERPDEPPDASADERR
jgi:diguanylate cyclase (GGDEF)-like protein